jgi:hypothetical protein
MGAIQFGNNLSHKHYRGKPVLPTEPLRPFRPVRLSAPACSDNVVHHQFHNLAKLVAGCTTKGSPHSCFHCSLAVVGPCSSTHSFAQHSRSLLQLICHLRTHPQPPNSSRTYSRNSCVKAPGRHLDLARHAPLCPDFSSPGRCPSPSLVHFFSSLLSTEHVVVAAAHHISSRPAVASGVSRTKCGELRERLLGPKRALGGQTGGHHGPTTTNCIPLILEAVRHKHR